MELDPSDNCAIGRVRGFLLNDSFMIASWLPNKYTSEKILVSGLIAIYYLLLYLILKKGQHEISVSGIV